MNNLLNKGISLSLLTGLSFAACTPKETPVSTRAAGAFSINYECTTGNPTIDIFTQSDSTRFNLPKDPLLLGSILNEATRNPYHPNGSVTISDLGTACNGNKQISFSNPYVSADCQSHASPTASCKFPKVPEMWKGQELGPSDVPPPKPQFNDIQSFIPVQRS